MDIHLLVKNLEERLPELEWKLKDTYLSLKSFPPGLFRTQKKIEQKGVNYVDEIKEDLQKLNEAKPYVSQIYLAKEVQRKINVLVSLCSLAKERSAKKEKSLIIHQLCSRKIWLENLEREISLLEEQQLSLQKTLNKVENHHVELRLNLQKDINILEKQLTLAREKLSEQIQR